MKIPTRLNKYPIVDCICEIRFEPTFPPEIVSGIIVSALNSLKICDIETLPVLQIPEAIRSVDTQWKFAPYYKAKIGEIIFQFGGRMVAFSSPMPYLGWEEFKPKIEEILGKLFSNGVVTKISRVARRTVNFFPIDILEYSAFQVNTPVNYEKK